MAYVFGDGFDLYATAADIPVGYWDVRDSSLQLSNTSEGRFPGSKAAWVNSAASGTPFLVKASGVNDAVHHVNIAVRLTSSLTTAATILFGLQLLDGTTGQCCVSFRIDGAILLQSGAIGGTTLATYPNAVTSTGVWYSFEFEVVIHPSAGSFKVRKNGNPTDDFSATGLNTRPGANSYANKLQIMNQFTSSVAAYLDDLLWRSDAASVPFIGDVRCYTRMPVSDASTQFARAPTTVQSVVPPSINAGDATTLSRYSALVPTYTGTVGTIVLYNVNAFTGNMKCAMFADSNNNPGAVLGSATTITNPGNGALTFTFSTPVAVTKGVRYWWGVSHDTTVTFNQTAIPSGRNGSGVSYAAFPAATPVVTSDNSVSGTVNITPTVNAELAGEPQQDGTTSYVYDAVAGHADFYNLPPIATPSSAVVALTTRAFMAKGDAGSRTGAVQLRAGNNTTTWNPADLVTTTLSGGNLTATFTGSTTSSGVRSIYGTNSGKYYFEIRFNSPNNHTVGLGPIGVGLGTIYSNFTGCVVVQSQFVLINNSGGILANMGVAPANNDILQIAVDFTAKLIWFRYGAVAWNNNGSANPATGVGGFDITSISSGALYAVAGGAIASGFTANFGGSAFANAVPSGFMGGFGTAGTTVAAPTVNLSTSFLWAFRTDTVNPATGTAWTDATANAATAGPVVIA